MATTKRRSSKTGGSLTEEQATDLLIGISMADKPFRDDDHRRQCWDANKQHLIDKDYSINGIHKREPGTRPHAWWMYSAPEPRRKIENGEYWTAAPGHEEGWRKYYGMDTVMHPADGWSEAGYPLVEYETEADYLRRLNLLLPGEAEALAEMQADE